MSGKRWKWFDSFGLLEVDIVTGQPLLGDSSNEPKKSKTHFIVISEEIHAPDGTRIADKRQMKDFEKRTGLTCELDSIREKTQREISRANDSNKAYAKDRKAVINDAIERASSSGFHRDIQYE